MTYVEQVKRTFLSQPQFAVVGASKDQSKWGTKVLKWYKDRGKRVTPVHPREPELEDLPTVKSLSDLSVPQETAVSVITAPPITIGLLKEAKALSIPALWLQPGTHDDTVVSFIRDNNMEDKVIYGGPCILVEGDGILKSML
ncbi:NAD P-binding protein [Gloeophyllum trabeum ATCC 11539]|uniref:NAD P-binding protein n=1 Tax=Gloeophyllum trabeum (strain ATCC 11539 / FP-39264 / Madison 617) TaxID=670483 RepID=S7QB38_GLOTA|nr:NAD P-binding protein [Gloeophyllum trabeum ATCC 11539]EPQ57146.1 NAD P-binding protein [Gloeophyllum trabeum ATCC 11539]